MNKFKVVGNLNIATFQNLLNQEPWYNIADLEISPTGYCVALMYLRSSASEVTTDRYLVINTTDYPNGLSQMLNAHPDYNIVDGEIFGTAAETAVVVISKDNGSSGGGGGTSDYNQLSNLPKINGKTLIGDKDAQALELALNAEGQINWWHNTVDPVSRRYFYNTVNNMPKLAVDDYLTLVATAIITSGDHRRQDIPYTNGRVVRVLDCDLNNPDQLFFMVDYLYCQFIKVYVETVGGVAYVRIATGAVNNYEALSNKPSINGVTLTGNKTYTNLGLEPSWLTKHNEFVANYGSITLKNSPYSAWADWITAHSTDGHYSAPYDGDHMVPAWVNLTADYPLQFLYQGQPYGKNASGIVPLTLQMSSFPLSVQQFLLSGKIDTGEF